MPLEDRAADTWEALVAVADEAGGDWPMAARHAATAPAEQAADDGDETLAVQLLRDCRTAFDGRAFVRTSELLEALRTDLEAPWVSHGAAGLTPRALAGILREFDIRSTTQRVPSGTAKGYLSNDFTDAWTRYLPATADPPDAEPGTPPEIRNIRNIGNTAGQRLALVTDVTEPPPAVAAAEPSAEGSRP
jgi:hypothetical protein